MAEEQDVTLSEAIQSLRREIGKANRLSEDEELRFKVGPIELEFGLEVSRERVAEGGLKFWVVSIGAGGKRASAATHTVRMALTPVGDDVLVKGRPGGAPE